MYKMLLISGCMVLCGCFAKHSMMTQETFVSVRMGEPIEKVIEQNGTPYKIETKNGMEEYSYVERVTNGNQLIYENHYILQVENGVVVGKRTEQEKTPPFELIYQDDPNHDQYP